MARAIVRRILLVRVRAYRMLGWAHCLYSPNCLEGGFPETCSPPVRKGGCLGDWTAAIGTREDRSLDKGPRPAK